jgi:hypothetical protein
MKRQVWRLFFLTMILSALIFACGGGNEQSSPAKEAEKPAPPKAEKSEKMSPVELGREIAGVYEKAMTELTDLLKDKPAINGVQPKVENLKQTCVTKLVELGKLREALDASGKASVDGQLRMKMNSMYNQPVWNAYNEIQQHYFKDKEFHEIIMSFNIITQYANFDLLKKQAPEEADRLGIQ